MSLVTEFRKILKRFGLEHFNRYYAIYRATVSDNEDPEKRGRLKLIIPAIADEEPFNYWAESFGIYAGSEYGIINIPENKENVWVQFENGNPQYPIWSHGHFKEEVKDDTNYPKKKLLYFASGQKITIDPKDEFIEIDNNGSKILIDSYGISIIKDGNKISLGTEGGSEFSAVKGETLEAVLKDLISEVESLNTEVLKILGTFIPSVAQNIPVITTALGIVTVKLAAIKLQVENIKSKNVNLDG